MEKETAKKYARVLEECYKADAKKDLMLETLEDHIVNEEEVYDVYIEHLEDAKGNVEVFDMETLRLFIIELKYAMECSSAYELDSLPFMETLKMVSKQLKHDGFIDDVEDFLDDIITS